MGSRRRLEERLLRSGVASVDLSRVADAVETLQEAGDDLSNCLWLWLDAETPDVEENRRLAFMACRETLRTLENALDIVQSVPLMTPSHDPSERRSDP